MTLVQQRTGNHRGRRQRHKHMHARWLLVGPALRVVAVACAPNAETTVSSIDTQQTLDSAPGSVQDKPIAAHSTSTTGLAEPASWRPRAARGRPMSSPTGWPSLIAGQPFYFHWADESIHRNRSFRQRRSPLRRKRRERALGRDN